MHRELMFNALEYMFNVRELVFNALELMFNGLEHKNDSAREDDPCFIQDSRLRAGQSYL